MSYLEILAFFINLLLASKNCGFLVWHQELPQIVDLSKMKCPNRIIIILNEIYFCNELRYKLDQRIQFVANFPATFANYLREKVTSII